jgi:hypothetical protein
MAEADEVAPEKQTERALSGCVKLGCGIPLALVALFVVLAVIGTFSDEGGSNSGEAWTACREALEAQLRNPATADFPLLDRQIDESAGGGWSIAGLVGAENHFGVEQRFRFTCEVSPDGLVTDSRLIQ